MTNSININRIKRLSESRIKNVPVRFHRFLLNEIDWDQRLIGISGARGAGKTTLMLQYIKTSGLNPETVMFVSLDDIFFVNSPLIIFAEQFFLEGGKYLFLDEVHKYPDWSHDLKQIYDNFPQLKVIFTSSSALGLYKGSHDLSRRLALYHLPGLSLREYLEFSYSYKIRSYTLNEILTDVSGIKYAFVVQDNTEVGYKNMIPLWLFGFLY